MRCIVAGSRYKTKSVSHLVPVVMDKLHKKHQITTLLHGDCKKSPDKDGEAWAVFNGVALEPYPADWGEGRGAGLKRNAEMASKADMLVAFWDGESRGTKHMIEEALRRPLMWVYVIHFDLTLEKYHLGELI